MRAVVFMQSLNANNVYSYVSCPSETGPQLPRTEWYPRVSQLVHNWGNYQFWKIHLFLNGESEPTYNHYHPLNHNEPLTSTFVVHHSSMAQPTSNVTTLHPSLLVKPHAVVTAQRGQPTVLGQGPCGNR